MGKYYADSLKDKKKTYFLIRSVDDDAILPLPTKYLKHKMNERCSRNTLKKLAHGLSYYMNFLEEQKLSIEKVLDLSFSSQQKHFMDYLYWVKAGNHCERKKSPSNNTCNCYLQIAFGYYEFLYIEYDAFKDLKVLEDRDITYKSSVGIRFKKTIKSFKGFLPGEKHRGKTIERDKIDTLLMATDNLRNQLLIVLLAETGFRIGELLGVHYTEDIDFDNRTITVVYREDNKNDSLAKNAEYRHQKISESAFELLELYMAENAKLLQKTEYLFISLYGETIGEPLTVNGVYSMLGYLETKTKIKATPHMLRHYYANERRKAGWNIELIANALGHKHIETTMNYIDIANDELEEATDQYYAKTKELLPISKVL